MAARQKGSFSLGGTLEILADAPADARLCVKTKSELTDANSYPYKYVGMIVSVEDEGKAYILTAADTTVEANWREVGGGSAEFPSGGSTGQALVKKSSADNDVKWSTITGIPTGGSTGQVLAKHSSLSKDVEWVDQKDTQKEILDNGAAVTDRPTLNFTDFDISDDSTNEETDIKAHRLTASELVEICSALPPTPTRYFKYSTTEQIVGEWLDGKPIYQKTIVDTMPVVTTEGKTATKYIPVGVLVDKYISSDGYVANTNGATIPMIAIAGNVDSIQFGRYVLQTNAHATPNQITLMCTYTTWSEKPVYITIQYTKTTD